MRKANVFTLLTLGIAAVLLLSSALPADAELICKRFRPSGPKVCWEASTGSVNCLAIAQGVAAKLAKDCTDAGEDCYVVVQCSIYGDVNPLTEKIDTAYCAPDANGNFPGDLPLCAEGCLLEGTGQCWNPSDHFQPQGTAFTLPGPLTSLTATATCDRGGTCVSNATITADGTAGCPNPNWSLYFTPHRFFGELSFCPGGFAPSGETYTDCDGRRQDVMECCVNDKRNKDGTCFKPYQIGEPTEGEPGIIRSYCELPRGCWDPSFPGYPDPGCFVDGDVNGLIDKDIDYNCQER